MELKARLLILLLVIVAGTCQYARSADDRPQAADMKRPTNDDQRTTAPNDTLWYPNAQKALWLSVIIPGAGQIYNRQYWKLPIIYGGLMGCAYAISWNGRLYNDYKQAYIDILLASDYTDPNASFVKILPDGYTIASLGGVSNYTSMLNNYQNTYRRNRDLSIIAAVAVYALSLIDAYVDAQLYNFDISPDLTLDIKPQFNSDLFNNKSAELHFSFNF